MSYTGNWCIKRENAIVPCQRQWLGEGPMENTTVHKHSFMWNCPPPSQQFYPQDNLCLSQRPLECRQSLSLINYYYYLVIDDDALLNSSFAGCTVNRMSYLPVQDLAPVQNYKPVRFYQPADIPMDSQTTHKLSYIPVDVERSDNPNKPKSEYHRPTAPMCENTTYNLRYIFDDTHTHTHLFCN